MNTWNWLLHFLIIFDLVAFGIYFGGDILFTAISKVQKKSKKDDDLDLYDFEIETAPQKRSLCVDSIRMLYSGEIDEFVEKELLPDAAETMNALSEAEKTAVSLLLKAYIGFLSEEATVDEQSFPMVKELLSYTQGSKEDGEKDAIDCLMEDTVSRTHRHREYYNNYQRYQLMQVDKERVIKVRLSPEDTITAEESMYELLSGSVSAGSYQGQLQVKINYSPLLDDSVYVTRLRVVATEDFPVTDLNGRVFSLYITNKIGRPANWSQLNNYFGEYSDSWYRFILDATGLPSLPYWSPRGSADPNNPDPERWTMTGTEVKAYAALVKEKLTEYNNEHPGNPLKHEDGEYKGQPVTMP